MRKRLLHLLNIRQDEAWLVTNLFWLQFFQGAGVAILNIIAFTLFLLNFDIRELPKVYMFSAGLLLLMGWLYNQFEHRVSVKALVPSVIVFMAASLLLFRLQFLFSHSAWLVFLLFSWYYVAYLFSNLEFWGVASLLFDTRQSKRLFGMIGAGDIVAKLIGYSVVGALATVVSTQDMLLLSMALILCALFFYLRLRRAGQLDIHIKHDHHHKHEEAHATASAASLVKSFFGNRMIATVATLSFIVVTAVTIISFSFLSEIQHQQFGNNQLASFIALFYTGGKVLAIVIRLLLTGRITNLLGTKGSLLISPVILLLFLGAIIGLNFFGNSTTAVLYIFGLMAIITEVLKISLQDPVFLSLMQPLSSNLRLKGHMIVKGVMDPFALAFSGLMLFILVKAFHQVDLVSLSFALFLLLIIWVAMIFLVDREYVRALVTALNKRYSVGQEIDLDDEKTSEVLLDKISTGDRGEAIYILNLLEKKYSEGKEPLVLKALEHPKPEVRMEAIKLAERKKILSTIPAINSIIQDKSDSYLLPEAVKAKCMLEPDELENAEEFLNEKDARLIKASILGFMTSGGIGGMVIAGQKLMQLIESSESSERVIAAEVIGELGVQSFYKPLQDLMKDENNSVVKAAITAAGKVKNEKLIPQLMEFFMQRQYEKLSAYALEEAGTIALPEIDRAINQPHLSVHKRSKLILICGKIGIENAVAILDDLVWKFPSFRYDIFHALHLCEFRVLPQHRVRHEQLMHQYINSATRILMMIHALRGKKHFPGTEVLYNALSLELNEIRDLLLLLFSFVYDKEKMVKAKNAFQIQRKESIANALEMIEIEVPKEISQGFIRLFEQGSTEEKYESLPSHSRENLTYEKIVDEILHNRNHHYHRWTRAAALYSLKAYSGKDKLQWLQFAKSEKDILIKQTAEKLLVN